MVGRMSWTIAKIFQSRNARTSDLTEEEIRGLEAKFHRSRRNAKQASRDTWARYTRDQGRGEHVVKRTSPKPPFRTARHRWSPKKSALADDSSLSETPRPDGQIGKRGHSDESPQKPATEEPSHKAQVRKSSLERRLFEDVRQQCLSLAEGRPLAPGQQVTIYEGRILTLQIGKLPNGELLPDLSEQTKGFRYVVWIGSEIPGVLRSTTIMVGGSSAREAATQALRRLEDELISS